MSAYSSLRKKEKYFDYSLSSNKDQVLFSIFSEIDTKSIFDSIIEYPEDNYLKLKELLKLNFGLNSVLLGSGSEDIIFRINKILLKDKRVGIIIPSFYRIYETVKTPYLISLPYEINENILDGSLLKEEVKKCDCEAFWIANPNPITGKAYVKEVLLDIIKSNSEKMFLVDEVSLDSVFESEQYSLLRETKEYNNLIVVRSFSKLYGFPGLRFGYATGSKCLKDIEDNSQVFPINGLNSLVVESIINNYDKFQNLKEKIDSNKQKLKNLIKNTDYYCVDSLTNTMILGSNKENRNVWDELKRQNILSFSLENEIGVISKNSVRVTIHSDEDIFFNLYKAIKEILYE